MLDQGWIRSLVQMLTAKTTRRASDGLVIITGPATTLVQRQMTDRSTFALPNEIYPVTVSHFQLTVLVQLNVLINVRKNLWRVVRHHANIHASKQRILHIIL